MEAFDADAQLLPMWVQHWMNFIGIVLILSTLAFLFRKDTRMLGVYQLVSIVFTAVTIMWMHSQMGMVRLLGISHIIVWTPLVIYLWQRVRNNPPGPVYRVIMWVTLLTLVATLAFDYYDVFRYIMGERAPIVSATST